MQEFFHNFAIKIFPFVTLLKIIAVIAGKIGAEFPAKAGGFPNNSQRIRNFRPQAAPLGKRFCNYFVSCVFFDAAADDFVPAYLKKISDRHCAGRGKPSLL
ncbi:MAG: hypothetical protein IJV41_11655 [Oscillospiraceae bacterium]|nr:hypothetical protein [Oscillospiraceae bacterium]